MELKNTGEDKNKNQDEETSSKEDIEDNIFYVFPCTSGNLNLYNAKENTTKGEKKNDKIADKMREISCCDERNDWIQLFTRGIAIDILAKLQNRCHSHQHHWY